MKVMTPRVRPGFPLVVAMVLAPFVVLLVATVGRDWHPGGDIALEVMQANEVGGSRTPLTGAYSRWGWDHPGPLLVWAMAPFTQLFGSIGALLGVAVLNGTAVAGALLVATRRGGWPLTVLSALAVLVLCTALGPGQLIDPWNPRAAVLPFLAFVLLAWSFGDGDVAMAPWLVAAGSFVVQAHAGYAVLVVGLIVIAALMGATWRDRAGSAVEPNQPSTRRSLLIALGVGVALWLPPVLQQLTGGDGNLGALIAFARQPTEPVAGWSTAWGVLGAELGFPGAWLAGGDDGPFGVPPEPVLPAVVRSNRTSRGRPEYGPAHVPECWPHPFEVLPTLRCRCPNA